MRKVERVLVVGRDAAVWLTALGLQRAFGRTGVEVRVVELPTALGAADIFATTPALQGLHRMLGLEEPQVLAACAGAYALAQRFSAWSRTTPAFVHAYDTHGARLNNVDFIHYWVKARGEGMKVALEDFSLGAGAAKAGRFIEHTDATELFSKAAYGYHLDAKSYVQLVRQQAIRAGVAHAASDLADVQVGEGRINQIELADGRAIQADLYVDASGPAAVLASAMANDAFESWRRWLPCDQMLTGAGRPLKPLPGFSDITALEAGWVGLYPLQNRTGVVAMFDSAATSASQVVQSILQTTGVRIEGPTVQPFAPGARAQPWNGNCVAIGSAAFGLEPLDAASLHMVHVGLTHLVTLFPTDADTLEQAHCYNAAMQSHAANVRDFQVAHYKLNGRMGEPFWDRARQVPAPEPLEYKLGLFAARGRVALYEDEAFDEDDWMSILVGHGLIPRDYDPLADRFPRDEQIQNFQRMLRFIAVETQEMPSLQAHAELNAAPSRSGGSF